MARSDNICAAQINHIPWDDDSHVSYFMKSKGDQEGVIQMSHGMYIQNN